MVHTGVGLRNPFVSILAHGVILLALIVPWFPGIPSSHILDVPLGAPSPHSKMVIYYLGPRLPTVPSVAGGELGHPGTAAGREFYHPTEAIHIARGEKRVDKVVDVPAVKLPPSKDQVANLLAILKTPPPMPVPASPKAIRSTQLKVTPPVHALPPPQAPATASIPPPPVPRATVANPKLTVDVAALPPVSPKFLREIAPARPVPKSKPVEDASMAGPIRTVTVLNGSSSTIETKDKFQALIISADPGKRMGIPEGGAGTLAMSANGIKSEGMEGPGTGSGLTSGAATGSEPSQGSGGDSSKMAAGSTPQIQGGMSQEPGAGGAGGNAIRAAAPGISIRGGEAYVASFGSGADSSPIRMEQGQAPAVVIVSSSRAGGLLDPALAARGARVYTTYLETGLGTVVLQFADLTDVAGFQSELMVPQPIHTDIPDGRRIKFTIVACTMNRAGVLNNLRIVRAADPSLVPTLLAALVNWRFRPALRGDQPVEVTAVFGFAANTR
jgi:hypothetical protein